MPAATPPPGVTANFDNPPSNAYILIIVSTICMVLLYVTMTISLYAKINIRKNMALDDWSRLIATFGTTIYYIASVIAVTKGKFGIHMYDLTAEDAMCTSFIVSGFFTNWLTALVWPFAKSSFFLLYLEMFRTIRWQRYANYVGLFVNWGFYTAALTATLYYTSPAPGETWQESITSERYAKMEAWIMPIASINLVIDVYILIIPIIPILGLKMNNKKKLGVLSVFATGVLACVASSLSIYFKMSLNWHYTDYSYYTTPVLIMCLVEMCVGVTASAMPSMALFFRHKGSKITKAVSRFSRSSQPRSSHSGNVKCVQSIDDSVDSDRWPLKDIKASSKGQYDGTDDTAHLNSVQTFIQAATPTSQVDADGAICLQYAFNQGYEDRGTPDPANKV
ncbi:hypothetical protein N7466_004066 [Penicillium verhagenii]|uniref:uncharacterized protein n=1 Tax=Penicillium verhagenii TaxID=1562060 RepID=UPI00254558E2|nr:uncharacterized protein N7466_004066 [Penicillium verhagenii]KAJ5934519.1 hypothetical protein N7466_004066 [Penicillium verhagenii]